LTARELAKRRRGVEAFAFDAGAASRGSSASITASRLP
jgi:hypothetical protein